MWTKHTSVVPGVIRTLGTIPRNVTQYYNKLKISEITPSEIWKAAMLGTAFILYQYLTDTSVFSYNGICYIIPVNVFIILYVWAWYFWMMMIWNQLQIAQTWIVQIFAGLYDLDQLCNSALLWKSSWFQTSNHTTGYLFHPDTYCFNPKHKLLFDNQLLANHTYGRTPNLTVPSGCCFFNLYASNRCRKTLQN